MKILIIGQAPPAKEQKVPYDSTLLYEILSWVGISKERAQEMFDFEAVSNEFPGSAKNKGHFKPSKEAMKNHWNNTLSHKVNSASKIIVLGKVAEKYLSDKAPDKYYSDTLRLLHPSRRNYSKIMKDKNHITEELQQFLQ